MAHTPESELQAWCDDYLINKRISFIRLPDGFWGWLYYNGTEKIKKWFRFCFGGIADNTCFIPITDKYSLCLHLELKTKIGKLHGRQKIEAQILPWQIARSTKEIEDIINKFQEDAKKIKKHLDNT